LECADHRQRNLAPAASEIREEADSSKLRSTRTPEFRRKSPRNSGNLSSPRPHPIPQCNSKPARKAQAQCQSHSPGIAAAAAAAPSCLAPRRTSRARRQTLPRPGDSHHQARPAARRGRRSEVELASSEVWGRRSHASESTRGRRQRQGVQKPSWGGGWGGGGVEGRRGGRARMLLQVDATNRPTATGANRRAPSGVRCRAGRFSFFPLLPASLLPWRRREEGSRSCG
jgi:hypothetical protein